MPTPTTSEKFVIGIDFGTDSVRSVLTSSWNWIDVALSTLLMLIIVGIYLYFQG